MIDPDSVIHPTALVHPTVVVGRGTVVWQHVHLMSGATLGSFCSVGGTTEIGRGCSIGSRTRIGYGVFLPSYTKVGEGVFIGPRVTMTDDKHPRVNNPHYKADPPVIEDYVNIGAGAVILPGVILRTGCTVGAGAVVTKDVAPWDTVVGCPATPIKRTETA